MVVQCNDILTKHRVTKRSTTNATSLRCTLCGDLLHL